MGNEKKTISTRVTEREYEMFETYANTHNVSISALIKLFMTNLLNGELDYQKGELRSRVDPIDLGILEETETPFGVKVDKKLRKLLDRGYPESFIFSMKEQILSGLDSQINMLPKKFDARRMRDSDFGC